MTQNNKITKQILDEEDELDLSLMELERKINKQ